MYNFERCSSIEGRNLGNVEGSQLRKLTLAGILTAAALLLSTVSIPFGPTRCFPFQHAVNAIAGILLGPWWAVGMAFITSVLRVSMGTGTLFAFPGSIPGALFVGIAYKFLHKDWAAFAEPIGTGFLGAWLSACVLGPMIGKNAGLSALIVAFLTASVPGSCIGFAVVFTLRRMGLVPEPQTDHEKE